MCSRRATSISPAADAVGHRTADDLRRHRSPIDDHPVVGPTAGSSQCRAWQAKSRCLSSYCRAVPRNVQFFSDVDSTAGHVADDDRMHLARLPWAVALRSAIDGAADNRANYLKEPSDVDAVLEGAGWRVVCESRHSRSRGELGAPGRARYRGVSRHHADKIYPWPAHAGGRRPCRRSRRGVRVLADGLRVATRRSCGAAERRRSRLLAIGER